MTSVRLFKLKPSVGNDLKEYEKIELACTLPEIYDTRNQIKNSQSKKSICNVEQERHCIKTSIGSIYMQTDEFLILVRNICSCLLAMWLKVHQYNNTEKSKNSITVRFSTPFLIKSKQLYFAKTRARLTENEHS